MSPHEWRLYSSDDLASRIEQLTSTVNFTIPTGNIAETRRKSAAVKKELSEKLAQPGWHFLLSARRGQLTIQWYSALDPSKASGLPGRLSFGQFRYSDVPAMMLGSWMFAPGSVPNAALSAAPPNPFVARERAVSIPFWPLVVLFTVWPLSAFVRGPWRRARRLGTGCCRACGYNLTGLPDPRCPECGSDVELLGTAAPLEPQDSASAT